MKWFWRFGIPGLVVVVLLVLYWTYSSNNDRQYAKIKRGNIVESVYGIGTVKSDRDYVLKIGVSSVVDERWVREGDFVSKDQKLIKLQDLPIFKAPFNGVVSSLNYNVGESVFPQAPILTLTDMENRYLKVSLEQTGALKVKPGLKARINFEGLRNQTFRGEVVSVYSSEDRLLLRIQFDELPSNILPGMSADVAVVIGEIQDVLLVPVSAISVGEVTLKSGKKIQIQIGVADGAMAQLTSSNLKEGDEVILNASSSH